MHKNRPENQWQQVLLSEMFGSSSLICTEVVRRHGKEEQ